MSDTSGKPQHIGLILDGNRRWAVDNKLPKLEGHRRGYENLKKIGIAAIERDVKFVSAYVFSTENWKRSQEEVKYLMDLALDLATNQAKELMKHNIKLRFLGSPDGARDDVLDALKKAEDDSAGNTKGTLGLCFNYGGHLEITEAVRSAANDGVDMASITKQQIEKYLYAPEIPPVDLLIRTSGELRLSNFMLWRAAYSELLFVDKHWPDFNEDDLDSAIAEYSSRSRRFGAN